MTRRRVAAVLIAIVGIASSALAQTTPRAPGTSEAVTARGGAALERLRNNIEQIARSVDTHWGIYIKCLETSEEIAINADEAMDTMSVIKLPLMVEAFRQIEAGQFALTDKYTLKAGDRRPGTGVLRSMDDGTTISIKDALTLMTIVSDNTATDIIFGRVGGPDAVNALMKSYGLNSIRAVGSAESWFTALNAAPNSTVFHNEVKRPFGLSSPRDMGRLIEKIVKGEAVSKAASAQMLDILGRQVYATGLPKYVVGFQVPHKTGDFVPFVANDVGVLMSERRKIVMSIFTDKRNVPADLPTRLMGPAIEDAIGRIAQQVADYFVFTTQ